VTDEGQVWDVQGGEAQSNLLKQVKSAQFSPDGKRIVTASQDKTARVGTRKPASR